MKKFEANGRVEEMPLDLERVLKLLSNNDYGAEEFKKYFD